MPKPPAAQAKPDKAPVAPLPPSLMKALPAAPDVLKHAAEIAKMLPKIRKEMEASRKHGAVQLARSFVVLHRLMDRIKETLDPLTNDENGLFAEYKRVLLPELFDQEGVKSIPLAEGYRVGVSAQIRASIRKDMKDKAYAWLRANGHGDIITATVNASTLSASAKDLIENQNKDLPEDMFNVALMPTTSVTKT